MVSVGAKSFMPGSPEESPQRVCDLMVEECCNLRKLDGEISGKGHGVGKDDLPMAIAPIALKGLEMFQRERPHHDASHG